MLVSFFHLTLTMNIYRMPIILGELYCISLCVTCMQNFASFFLLHCMVKTNNSGYFNYIYVTHLKIKTVEIFSVSGVYEGIVTLMVLNQEIFLLSKK